MQFFHSHERFCLRRDSISHLTARHGFENRAYQNQLPMSVSNYKDIDPEVKNGLVILVVMAMSFMYLVTHA